MSRRIWCLVLLALLGSGACGSTLQPTEMSGGPSSDAVTATTAGTAPDAASDSVPSGEETTANPGVVTTDAPAADNGVDVPVPDENVATSAPPSSAQASTDTSPIRIGIASVNPGALFSAFGAETPDDLFSNEKALIASINEAGGVGGRLLEPTYFLADIGEDQFAEGQEACEMFTTDNQVDVVVANSANEVLVSCLGQHNIAVIDTNAWVPDAASVDRFANWILPNTFGVDRYAAAAVETSLEQGTLQSGDKLGVIYEDCPWGPRVYESVITPIATKAGVEVKRATIKCIENLVADLGPVSNQATAAALRFRSEGVTDVLVLTAGEGFVVSRFTVAAAQQRYFPQYILTTNAYPYTNSDPEAVVQFDAASVKNMSGIGWIGHQDMGPSEQPTPEQAGQRRVCEEAIPEPLAGNVALAWEQCDIYFGLRDILADAGGRFDAGSIVAAYRAWAPASLSSTLTGGRRSARGVGFVRPFTYDAGSGRFTYSGELRPVR